jgi:photosystem II stability/assembly factor-like uncharacterized protein
VAISGDAGMTFRTATLDRAADLAAVANGQSGSLVLVGENGISHASPSAFIKETAND